MLEARPVRERTRADYQDVIKAYRRVYLECPTSAKADPSLFAAAQLQEEMGRRFQDEQLLRAAIQQYEFLRRQYPGSKSRFAALFRIGEIYKDDLHDPGLAQQTFEQFVRRYPRNQFADQARQQLAQLAAKPELRSRPQSEEAALAAPGEESEERSGEDKETRSARPGNQDAGGSTTGGGGRLVRITGIRAWSNAEGTRVAVELEGRVPYESQTIENPHRVFFDLFDTRLDPQVIGKGLRVTPGLVKRIRISQFKPHQTRVVLEVGGDLNFETRWLSGPPRLLIELRSEPTKTRGAAKEASATMPAKEAAASPDSSPSRVANDTPDSAASQDDAEKDSAADLLPADKDPEAGLRRCSDQDPHSSSCSAGDDRPGATSVVISNGVKKTIVEADDDDSRSPTTATAKASALEVANQPTPTKDKVSRQAKAGARDSLDAREAQPMASGDRSLTRVLGLKIGKIVIDPGHGGHDTGTIGPHGLQEKDLVLEVSLRLGKLLESRLGAQVIYTRQDDNFIPLETRTAIANREGADLFISVHANSSHDPAARGVETYYLNFTSSPEALEVAARENAISEESIHELQDLVKKIALKEKIEESREFAVDVDQSLLGGLRLKNPGLRDRGVKKAPFIVLIGANMPSILAEISFLSNPTDERRLKTADYRQRIAEALYRGIAKYVSGLSGVKVATRMEKTGAP